MTIDWPQVTILVGPLIPDGHFIIMQVLDIRVTTQEPQQLMDDAAKVQLLRRQQRKTVRQTEAHLVAEHAFRACTRAVSLHCALIQDALQEV